MIQIFKAEVSLNGRDSIVEVIDTDYVVYKNMVDLVRTILTNSYSLEYEDEVKIYLHRKDLKR